MLFVQSDWQELRRQVCITRRGSGASYSRMPTGRLRVMGIEPGAVRLWHHSHWTRPSLYTIWVTQNQWDGNYFAFFQNNAVLSNDLWSFLLLNPKPYDNQRQYMKNIHHHLNVLVVLDCPWIILSYLWRLSFQWVTLCGVEGLTDMYCMSCDSSMWILDKRTTNQNQPVMCQPMGADDNDMKQCMWTVLKTMRDL